MSAFGVTPTAEVIEGTGEFDLMMLARMGEHELVNQIVYICKKYGEIVEKNKQDHLSTLETKRDEQIEVSRKLKANSAQLHRATFAALQEIAGTENEMRRADNALAQLHYAARHSKLLTRAEIAEQERQIEQAKKRCNDAQFSFSTATRAYNMAVQMENEANAAAANAEAEARGLDAQLRQALGEKHVRGTGGFYIS